MAKKKKMDPEKRAPGWQIRCLKCDFTEPWGKYSIRLKAVGRTYTYGRCPQCKRVRIHVIEKVPPAEA
jgi:phage FluMu protein Com